MADSAQTTLKADNGGADGGMLRLQDVNKASIVALLDRFEMLLQIVKPTDDIPGSYWGDEEAGLINNRLLARTDTPLHSILHETCHYICMDSDRRRGVHTNAGGDYDEENAVCYLQILLSEFISTPTETVSRKQMFADMDSWGYTFRLGSAQSWFEQDADDARDTLFAWGLIDKLQQPTFQLRGK